MLFLYNVLFLWGDMSGWGLIHIFWYVCLFYFVVINIFLICCCYYVPVITFTVVLEWKWENLQENEWLPELKTIPFPLEKGWLLSSECVCIALVQDISGVMGFVLEIARHELRIEIVQFKGSCGSRTSDDYSSWEFQ